MFLFFSVCWVAEMSDWAGGGVPRSEAVGAVALGALALLGAGSAVADPAGLFTVELRVAADELSVLTAPLRGSLTGRLFVSVEVALSD